MPTLGGGAVCSSWAPVLMGLLGSLLTERQHIPSVLSCFFISLGFLILFEFQLQFHRLPMYMRHISSWTASAFLHRLLCCRVSLQPLSQRTCIIRSQMGWEWKHELLYLANFPYIRCPRVVYTSNAEEGLTFVSKVSMHFPSYTPSSEWVSNCEAWLIVGHNFPSSEWVYNCEAWLIVRHNFPVFFTFRVTHQHVHSDVKWGLTKLFYNT